MFGQDGHGGIEKVELVMEQWQLVSQEPFDTREKAQRFVNIYSNTTYGKAGEQMLEAEWQITESENGFLVWYKPL